MKIYSPKSPEDVTLKAERMRFMQEIEVYRKKIKGDKPIEKKADDKVRSGYYKRKKEKQKIRRKEKHELIKNNRKALVEVFGDAVFKRGWPISRQEIKFALGL